MFERLAVVGFVVTALETAAYVSNAVQTFTALCNSITEQSRQDVDTRIKLLLFELESCERKISDWTQTWIPGKVDSEAYFKLLWGNAGQREVKMDLECIKSRATSIIQQAEMLADWLRNNPHDQPTWSYVNWLDWRRLSMRGTQGQGESARDELSNSVGELGRRIVELREATDLHFRLMQPLALKGNQKPARLDDAIQARAVSAAAYDACCQQANILYLEMNLLDNENDVDKVADVFDWGDLQSTYRLLINDAEDDSLMRHVVLNMFDDRDLTGIKCPVENELLTESRSKTWQCELCSMRSAIVPDGFSHQSSIVRNRHYETGSFLPYLTSLLSESETRRKAPLTQFQKKAFAFRIVECSLFLIGTPWISNISHNVLYDQGTFDNDGRFFLRINLAKFMHQRGEAQSQKSTSTASQQLNGNSAISHFDGKEMRGRRCPHPGCGRILIDLQAHMLTHEEPCPGNFSNSTYENTYKSCRTKHNRTERTLAQHDNTVLSESHPTTISCPQQNSQAIEAPMNDLAPICTFEQVSTSAERSSHPDSRKLSHCYMDTPGRCSVCSASFKDAQGFDKHLNACTLQATEQETQNEAVETPSGTESGSQLLETDQLRRIGILLIETALEETWDAMHGNSADLAPVIVEQLINKMGESYQQACCSCLSLSNTRSEAGSILLSSDELLAAFYTDVYLKLRDSYNDLRTDSPSKNKPFRRSMTDILPKWNRLSLSRGKV